MSRKHYKFPRAIYFLVPALLLLLGFKGTHSHYALCSSCPPPLARHRLASSFHCPSLADSGPSTRIVFFLFYFTIYSNLILCFSSSLFLFLYCLASTELRCSPSTVRQATHRRPPTLSCCHPFHGAHGRRRRYFLDFKLFLNAVNNLKYKIK